jgi:hypothetical protein
MAIAGQRATTSMSGIRRRKAVVGKGQQTGPVNHLHPLPVSSERGVAVTHTTIMRRVLRHVPEDEKRSGR